jgi:uncharacterized protein YciI
MSDPTSEKGLFIIHCMDDISGEMIDKGGRFGGSAKRFSVYGEHKAYLAVTSDPSSPSFIHKIAAGPLESDDKRYMIGSFFIVEATREEAENFNRNDPFFINGVWEKITISRWVSTIGIKPADAVMNDDDFSTIHMVVR